MTFDVLGSRKHADVRAQLQNRLKNRREESVIDCEFDAVAMRDLADLSDITQLQRRISRGLHKNDFRARSDRLLDEIGTRGIDKAAFNAQSAKHLLKQTHRAAVHHV